MSKALCFVGCRRPQIKGATFWVLSFFLDSPPQIFIFARFTHNNQTKRENNLIRKERIWKKMNSSHWAPFSKSRKCTHKIYGHIWSRGGKRLWNRKKITVVVRRGARTVLYIFITLSRRLRRRLGWSSAFLCLVFVLVFFLGLSCYA